MQTIKFVNPCTVYCLGGCFDSHRIRAPMPAAPTAASNPQTMAPHISNRRLRFFSPCWYHGLMKESLRLIVPQLNCSIRAEPIPGYRRDGPGGGMYGRTRTYLKSISTDSRFFC
ncbi:hypothetical protein [Macropodid alphaherpesvirus 1]|uniref:Uncharacterized protein n=1 Tax=Macropodid alphaherpesvirus 1 TaxID=137443 RepID=A0A120HUJ0_9ALPH|nr:hypothetical protein [Macropodid alphaherpesvirus 1]AMB17063.1 hypothetical protein [Macropodid alphaherpesvirus 1]